jgi:hypothetical protein
MVAPSIEGCRGIALGLDVGRGRARTGSFTDWEAFHGVRKCP